VDDLLLTPGQYRVLWNGVQVTMQLLLYAFILGVILSLVIGLMRLSHRAWLRGIALVYVEIFRGISTIVLLFWFVFAFPILLGLDAGDVRTELAIIALGINMGGYGAEIVRGAILSVPKGQTEATIALNLTNAQRIRHIVLPQAMPVILPPMGNLTIEILKGTALVTLIGMNDLMNRIDALRVARGRFEDPLSIPVLFFNGLVIYFILAQLVNLFFRLAERRTSAMYRQRSGRRAVDTELSSASATGVGAGGGTT
jgi:polar amino acid transport system permease protein